MAANGYKIQPALTGQDRETRYTGGYTTRTYGSHRGTKIDAIQLELGSDLRAKANLERTANDLAACGRSVRTRVSPPQRRIRSSDVEAEKADLCRKPHQRPLA